MDASRIARRFPLVPRPRPACLPLAERVQEIHDLARSAEQNGDLGTCAAALNRAALIASDCGLPDLARDLCWRHAEIFLRAQPLGAQEARYALEPLVNLARLNIRDGDGEGAYQLLDALNQAVKRQSDVVIDGRTISFRDLTTTAEDRRTVCQWLWTVLLGDGTRALVAANQWERVRAHAVQHKGIGRRLFDGRQVEIVSLCLGGDPTSALRTLEESTPGETWERPVAECLALLCLATVGEPPAEAASKAAAEYLNLEATSELVVFRTRVGLTVLDLCPDTGRAEIARRLVRDAVASGDGYVAREVLAHTVCPERMSERDRCLLSEAVSTAGLGGGSMPSALKRKLLDAVQVGGAAAERVMQKHSAL
ncbi:MULTISPECIES: hypothetical protein [unclassified Streptomyces]|uniref:hypothetical protein n=1 Tax=unclassified Streptomyces TaxID=2593676 RepID=UPI000DAC25FD|nr:MULTISPECIES: hypothetical protein [unclassified Streptomyces]PZT76065.1 hypothetical protein DNK56_22085 [Streptomyces sp. AC1-42W]PZT79984.1 hypothetical protein DNK55_10600 [Streptomyces sp. AC1-42T]